MSFTRRQFLLSTAGASVGAIIPSFYFRALEFFEQFEEPLLEVPQHVTQDLCVLDNCGELELCLGDPLAEPPMNQDYQWDMWFIHHGPSARAHHYLSSLDLGNELSGPNAVGGLDFFEDSNMVSCWRGVRPEDEVTLSLLQQRLNDLGTGIRIVTGYSI